MECTTSSGVLFHDTNMRLILASASPRRADLLRAAGFEFETRRADVDEGVRPDESPTAYVRRLAGAKSAAVFAALEACAASDLTPAAQDFGDADEIIVIGADTTVVVDAVILGKPENDEEAAA